MATQYANGKIITEGLVLCLNAADLNSYPGSGTTWFDMSGEGNNGTLTNSPTFNSSNGGSVVFDGTNDYVSIGINKSCNVFTGNFTISAWAYRVGGVSYGNIIGDYYTNNTFAANEWQIMMGPDGQFNLYNNTGGYIISNTSAYGTNVWINVCVSRISSTITMYVNGSSVSTSTNSTTFGTATGNLNIGIDGNNSAEPLNGRIANVLIYKNKGLTASEVLQNYNAQKSRFGLK